jgi:hypothetical protein
VAHALLILALALNEPEPPPETLPTEAVLGVGGWHFAGLPIASYSSDVGLTLGGALYVYRHLAEQPGEHDSMTLSLSYATRGPRALDAGLGLRRLLGTSLRTFWNLHLGDDTLMPYWGEGARLGGLSVPTGSGTPPEPYRYHDRRVFASAGLQGAIAGSLGWHLRVRFLSVDITRPSELLAASSPPGALGGKVALGEVGLLFDTRDRELATRRGVFVTAALFAAPPLAEISDFAFHGYNACVRLYVPLWPGATLAARGLYDRKLPGVPGARQGSGAVPFFERMLYEGLAYNEGLGGAGTLRGIARYRVAGEEKALGNVELRANLYTMHVAGHPLEYGISVGVDAGWARQPGYTAVEATSAAAGLRVTWDRALVLRVEMGRARGGDNTLYVVLGERY